MLLKHSKSRETPIVIYVDFLLNTNTRKRQLINKLYNIAYHMAEKVSVYDQEMPQSHTLD